MKISNRRYLLDFCHAISYALDNGKVAVVGKDGDCLKLMTIDSLAANLRAFHSHVMPAAGPSCLAGGYNPAQLSCNVVDHEKGWRLLNNYEMAYGHVPSDLQVWDEETQCWVATQAIPRQDGTYRTKTARLSPYPPTREEAKTADDWNPYNQTIIAKTENFRVGWSIRHPTWEAGEGMIVAVRSKYLAFTTDCGSLRRRTYGEVVGYLVREPGKSTWMRVIEG